MTAEELHELLERDPAFVARRDARERELQMRKERLRVEQRPLLADLRAVGIDVASVWDLVSTRQPYPQAIPVLLKHLRHPYSAKIREGMARALGVPEARSAWPILKQQYLEESDKFVKEGFAIALALSADSEVLDELIDIARNRRHGSSRTLLLLHLRKSRDPRALAALVELREDPDLQREIEVILKRRAKSARRSNIPT